MGPLARVSSYLLLCLAAGTPAVLAAPVDDEEAGDLHRDYGFDGLIISKFNDGLAGLLSADVDGDGRGDLVVVNNAKAKIELLIHRGDDEELEADELELANELPDEVHFRRESLATEQRVWALAMGDLDGDGRADAAFTGDSGKLTVALAGAELSFAERVRLDLDEPVPNRDSVRIGDVNGDGRPDVVVMTQQTTDLFVQDGQGRWRRDQRLPNATEGADGFDLVDLDGDSRLDLLYVASETEWPLRYRFGQQGGSFGPEMRSHFAEIRSYTAADLDGDPAAEIVVVGRRSGRSTVLELVQGEAGADDDLAVSSLRFMPFSRLRDANKRDVTLADLDADGFPDLISAESSAARLMVYRGGVGGQFHGGTAYPSLLGASRPVVRDVDADGLPEIVLGAPDEGAIGLAEVDGAGRIAFPETLGATDGDLAGLDVADQDGDGVHETWIVVGEGRGRSRDLTVRRVSGGEPVEVEVEGLKTDPSGLSLVDLDRDGLLDVLLYVPTETPRILLADGPGSFRAIESNVPGLGVLEDLSREGSFIGDVDGDGTEELLVPGTNFARALHLDGEGRPVVVAQYNLESAAAEVSAVTAADMNGDGRPEIVLADRASGTLVVMEQGGDLPELVARVDLGGFVPDGIAAADIDGNGTEDLVLWDDERFACVQAGGVDPRFEPTLSYETEVKGAFLDRVAAGDVNADGDVDLVLTETNKHLMHIAAVGKDAIRHALKFPVFEARLFESSRRSSREPREVVVADVTGDALADVAILVHDRVIVYPQEPAP